MVALNSKANSPGLCLAYAQTHRVARPFVAFDMRERGARLSAAVHGIISLIPNMADPGETTPLDKQRIRETIAGYAAAAEYIEQERIERLRRMTDEEARANYAALMNFHESFKNDRDKEGLQRLEAWRLQEKVALRQAFEKVARARGLL